MTIPQNTINGQKKIGKLIASLRERNNMTQSTLAKLLNTSQSAVARMERGQQNFSTEMLSRISAVFNKSIIELGRQAVNLKITGGKKLSGTITTNTAKNAALSIIIASLLNKGRTRLENVPKIEEVYRIIEVLVSIGASVKWLNGTLEIIPPKKVAPSKLNKKTARMTRSAIMLIGPLVHLVNNFELPHTGGCKLGKRTIRAHLYALEKLGVNIETTKDLYTISVGDLFKSGLRPNENIIMYESGDTAMENVIMAASRIPGATTIKFASANYMVQDLCHFLETLGIRIDGIGTTTITVHGRKEIKKDVTYPIMEDPIESMLFLSIAATTKSAITIKRCPIDFLELELLLLQKMGFKYKIVKKYKGKNGKTNLIDIETRPSALTALDEAIHPRPYPGLNIDNLPFFVPIATQAEGRTLIHDWVYENRAIYYMELNKLGADITLADPHRIFINGPTKLKSAEIISPPALRPAAIILIAMLAAEGTSILRNIYSISRGYEDLAQRLKKLGANIEILQGI